MSTESEGQVKRPNFLIVVADDLGFSDVGCFGGEIQTPNIDRLAEEGIRFTDYHVAAACSPTRAMLLTGTDHHIAGLGCLIEWSRKAGLNQKSKDSFSIAPVRGKPGYEGFLNDRVVTVAEILKSTGYQTMISGKWHLGLRPERLPDKRGFERSFAHLPGCSNHFGYEPQYHEPPPPFFELTVRAIHSEDGQYVKELPKDFYSSDAYGDKLIQYLDDRKDKNDERPFFAYLAFTAPHLPLQAPKDAMKPYRGVYDEGPDVLREKRLHKMVEIGLLANDTIAHPVETELPEWDELTPVQKAKSCRAMEAYAGMVHQIDVNIGKVLRKLADQGEIDNTFIVFMSDNEAEAAAYESYPFIAGDILKHLSTPGYYDNSLDNIGNHNSYVWYGPRWGQASTAPSRLYKSFNTQGGIRVPLVIRYPKFRNGSISDAFTTVMDLVPTILEMAGVRHPAPSWNGREVVALRGSSMLAFLRGDEDKIHEDEFIHGWELCGTAALRKGRWKSKN